MAEIDNIKLAEQFNKLFSERRVLAAAVTREMRNQLELALQIATIVDNKKPEELAEKISAVTKAMQALKEQSQNTGDQAEKAMQAVGAGAAGAAKGAGSLDKNMKVLVQKFPALKSAGAGAFNGLIQGFKNILAVGTTAVSVVGGFADGIFKVGKSILAIPLKIFRGMIDLATSFSGDTSFLQALENLRKEFGNFKEDASKNVLGAFKAAQAGVTGTGLSTFRVLGTFAQQLEYFTEVAKGAGAQFHQFGTEIAENAGKIIAFDKGLGVGAENIKAYMDRAKVYGTNLQDQFLKTANFSLQMGEAFGMSQKVLAKDITMMTKDVKHFGSITQKEMAEAAIYTRKLGIEVKSLTGMMDAFDTFEDAATNAAMLSQSFGTATDAFKLMSAQSPAEQLDMLRKSMAAAGKTTENMSRQELKLLAQTTHLDEATAQLAFSAKNQGISMDQIKKKGQEAENAPLRQAQALEKLAASIERVVMQGQMFKGGFIDQFLHGFSMGVKSSPAFLSAILAIRQALLTTMYAGVEVGKMFIKTFGGGALATSLGAITDAFKNWDKVMNQVKGAFKEFFIDLDVRKLIDNFKRIFIGHFSAKGTAGVAMADGMKGTFEAVVKMAASGGRYLIEELTKGLSRIGSTIRKYLTDPKSFWDAFSKASDNAQSGFMGMIKPLIDLAKDEKLWKDLFNALTDAFKAVWDLVKKWLQGPTFQKIIGQLLPAMFAMMVVPSVIRGAAGGLVGPLANSILGVGKQAGQQAVQGAKQAGASSPVGPGMMTGLFGNPYVAIAAVVAALGVVGVGVSKGLDSFQQKLEKDTSVVGGKLEKQLGASAAGVVQLLSFGAISDVAAYEMAKNFSKFADSMMKKIDEIFGPQLGAAIKTNLKTQLQFLSDFGGLIRSLISGDAEGIAKGFIGVFSGIGKMMINSLRMVLIDLPSHMIKWISEKLPLLTAKLNSLFADPSSSESIWAMVKANFATIGDGFLPQLWASLSGLFENVVFKLIPAVAKFGFALWRLIMKELYELGTKFGLYFGSKAMWMDLYNGLNKFGTWLNETFIDVMSGLVKAVPKIGAKLLEALKNLPKTLMEKGPTVVPVPEPAKKAEEAVTAPTPEASESDKMFKAQQTLDQVKSMQELQKIDIQKVLSDTSAQLSKIDIEKFNSDLAPKVQRLNDVMTSMSTVLENSSTTITAKLAPTLKATQDIIASVRELDNILASGDATKISVSKNLSKFANKAGLGGNEKYTIQNKGIQINLDLKVVMNAEELEEALVLRTKSIIKESIQKSLSLTDDQLRDKIRNH